MEILDIRKLKVKTFLFSEITLFWEKKFGTLKSAPTLL